MKSKDDSRRVPPILFLSHAGSDTEAAEALAKRLENAPIAKEHGLKVWIDTRDLDVGKPWRQQLEEVIAKQSTAFAVYVGSKGIVNWVESEVNAGLDRAKKSTNYPFIPIVNTQADLRLLPPFVSQYQAIEDIENKPEKFGQLLNSILHLEPQSPSKGVDEPFVGLRAFSEQDANLFFGRNDEVEQLVQRLKSTRLLVVIGDSGSGKSSLVKAGLLPKYRGGALSDRAGSRPDSTIWHVVQTRPASDPFQALADHVAIAAEKMKLADIKEFQEWIYSKTPRNVANALKQSSPKGAKILLVVDQFEELFSLSQESHRQDFLDVLLHLVREEKESDFEFRVVLTMRRDYYNLCSEYQEFYAFVEENPLVKFLVRRMTNDQLRDCIEKPLWLAGINAHPDFVKRVIQDVGDQPGELALLELALAESWAQRVEFGGDLFQSYSNLGSVAVALANLAETVYADKLSDEERRIVEPVLLRFIRLGETGGETKRLASREEFSVDAWNLIRKLASQEYHRLLQVSGESSQATAELSHEALARQWPRYQRWLQKAAKEGKRVHDKVISLAKNWGANNKAKTYLLTGNSLLEATALVNKRQDLLSESELSFIKASAATSKILEKFKVGAVISLIIFLAISIFLTLSLRDRNQNLKESQARNLIMIAAEKVKNGETTTGITNTLEAMLSLIENSDKSDLVSRAKATLYQGVRKHREKFVLGGHKKDVVHARFSVDGSLVVTASRDKVAQIWDATTGLSVAVLEGHAGTINDAEFDATSQRVVTASQDGTARIWNFSNPGKSLVLTGHEQSVNYATFNNSGSRVVTASFDHTARLWDASNGQEVSVFLGHKGPVIYAMFNPKGNQVVTVSQDRTARLWNLERRSTVVKLGGHTAPVTYAAFNSNGTRIITASKDQTARIWDTVSGQLLFVLQGHRGQIGHVDFSGDDSQIVTASFDNTARLWDSNTGDLTAQLRGHAGQIWHAGFNNNGSQVVTASYDGTAKVWDTKTGDELYTLGHDGRVFHAEFNSTGTRVVTASQDRTARIWDATPRGKHIVLTGHDDNVFRTNFSHNGHRVVTGSWDGTAKIWDAATGDLINSLEGNGQALVSATFHPDEVRVLTGSVDGTARITWINNDNPEIVLGGHEGPVMYAAFDNRAISVVTTSFDRNAIFAANEDPGIEPAEGVVRLWNPENGSLRHILRGHKGPVSHAEFSVDGTKLVTASFDQTAVIWDVSTGERLHTLVGHEGNVVRAVFNEQGSQVGTVSEDQTARLWDVTSGTLLHILAGHQDAVIQGEFNTKGTRFLTASTDNTARLWKTHTGAELHVLQDHVDVLNFATFNNDGTRVATASNDSTIRLWDSQSGEILEVLKGHDGAINYVAFNENGSLLISASEDKTCRIWPILPDGNELIDLAYKVLPPHLKKMAKEVGTKYDGAFH